MRAFAVIVILLFAGCSKPSGHTEKSALIGGGSGLAAGALVGSGTGALVGGPIGALGGAAVGAMTAPHTAQQWRRSQPQPLGRHERRRQVRIAHTNLPQSLGASPCRAMMAHDCL